MRTSIELELNENVDEDIDENVEPKFRVTMMMSMCILIDKNIKPKLKASSSWYRVRGIKLSGACDGRF